MEVFREFASPIGNRGIKVGFLRIVALDLSFEEKSKVKNSFARCLPRSCE